MSVVYLSAPCPDCAGTGLVETRNALGPGTVVVTCRSCEGTGDADEVPGLDPFSPEATRPADIDECTACMGQGVIDTWDRVAMRCDACGGTRTRGAA